LAPLVGSDSGLSAIALLESSTSDGVSPVSAAAALLVKEHVIASDSVSGVHSGAAVASEDSLAIDELVAASAAKVARVLLGKLLAEGRRRVRDAARAVQEVSAIVVLSHIHARALLTRNFDLVAGLIDVTNGSSAIANEVGT
jgi:hypothetical protein